ncbi:hypothetical protein [Halorientalis marina]|nr:hypothetical protein [Halorientalis marina]
MYTEYRSSSPYVYYRRVVLSVDHWILVAVIDEIFDGFEIA